MDISLSPAADFILAGTLWTSEILHQHFKNQANVFLTYFQTWG
jgi:hypothetical protein